MQFATDHLVARALLTLCMLGCGLGPAIADFNKTHATNPLWTPHARFHVVWQSLSYLGIVPIALWMIWTASFGDNVVQLYIAAMLAATIIVSFLVSALTINVFGGALFDANGNLPITTVNVAGHQVNIDGNAMSFTVMIALLLLAVIAI